MLHTVVTASGQCYRSKSPPKLGRATGTNGFPIETASFVDAETGDWVTVGPVKAICTPLRQ